MNKLLIFSVVIIAIVLIASVQDAEADGTTQPPMMPGSGHKGSGSGHKGSGSGHKGSQGKGSGESPMMPPMMPSSQP